PGSQLSLEGPTVVDRSQPNVTPASVPGTSTSAVPTSTSAPRTTFTGYTNTGTTSSSVNAFFSPIHTGSQLSLDGPAVVSERFAAEPQSEIERQTDEAFSELGYAKRTYKSRVALPAPVWFPWIDTGVGGVRVNDGSGAGNDGKGNQTKF